MTNALRCFVWKLYLHWRCGIGERIRKKLKQLFWRQFLKSLGPGSDLHPSVLIRSPDQISIGANTSVNHGSELHGGGGIAIGDGSMLAYDVLVFSDSRLFHGPEPLKSRQGRIRAPVSIGSDVWIGARAIILPGVTVCDHAIVGAGAVVTKNVDEWEIVGGNPARRIGHRLERDAYAGFPKSA